MISPGLGPVGPISGAISVAVLVAEIVGATIEMKEKDGCLTSLSKHIAYLTVLNDGIGAQTSVNALEFGFESKSILLVVTFVCKSNAKINVAIKSIN